MKIAIVGSRDFKHLYWVRSYIELLPVGTVIVSGGARGVDSEAVKWASYYKLSYIEFPADWETHGKRAGFLRNKTIVETADRVVAYWDGKSRGTKITIDLARAAGKPVTIVYDDGRIEQ